MRDREAVVSLGFFKLGCDVHISVVGYVQSRKQRTGASLYGLFCEFVGYLVCT